MPHVMLRAPLSELAGGREHEVPGSTVVEVLTALEHTCPSLSGWVLDERGTIRRHVNVYVNGQPAAAATPVGHADRVQVLPAITGG